MNRSAYIIPLFAALAVLTLLTGGCRTNPEISMESLLREMTDRQSATLLPDPAYSLKQFSSYDRASVAPGEEGWFANSDYSRFYGIDSSMGRREFILFDHSSPGAIVRWWMTFAGEGSYDGTLRIYIDGAPEPAVEDKVLKVISGNLLAGAPLSSSVSPLSPYHQRGHNLYLPIPYSRSCRVTYECDAVKESDGRITPSIYYNINYREYPPDTPVIPFSVEQLTLNSGLIEEVNGMLSSTVPPGGATLSSASQIAPGDTLSVSDDPGSPGAISEIRLQLLNPDNQALRSLVMILEFDSHQTVWVPIGDFFGTGHELHPHSTWYTRVDSTGLLSCYWVMPYSEQWRAMLVNFGTEAAECTLLVNTTGYSWQKNSMYFGAVWHEYNRIKTGGSIYTGGNDQHVDINYADITGKGRWMGDAVTVFNTVDAWWGEGDEKIFVDGESFPSSIGTGTEDYYGYAWCRPEVFSHPFISQPTGGGNFYPGMTVNNRYRTLDAIPFSESISTNIELWHWVPAVVNYALTSYFYALPGYTINITPDPAAVSMKVPSVATGLLPADDE